MINFTEGFQYRRSARRIKKIHKTNMKLLVLIICALMYERRVLAQLFGGDLLVGNSGIDDVATLSSAPLSLAGLGPGASQTVYSESTSVVQNDQQPSSMYQMYQMHPQQMHQTNYIGGYGGRPFDQQQLQYGNVNTYQPPQTIIRETEHRTLYDVNPNPNQNLHVQRIQTAPNRNFIRPQEYGSIVMSRQKRQAA